MNLEKLANKRSKYDRDGYDISNSTTVSEYILNSNQAKRLIYCRFGDAYI